MKLDLSKDKRKILKYINQRIKDYPVYVNCGPGEDSDPIQAVILGYYAAQGGYIYLVFDTRPGKNLDGNWTLHIDEPTMCHFPKWTEFYDKACEGKPVTLVLVDGSVKRLKYLDDDSKTEEGLNEFFGDMLRDLMRELSSDGTFAKLPLKKDAFMVVEEFDGYYFWPEPRVCKTQGRIRQ